jgi:hypothetical protein
MGALSSLATLGLNLALSQQAASRENKQLRADRDQAIRQLRLEDADDRRQRELALKRRLATQRARAGAAGIGSSGGSADAVLAGLEAESRALQSLRAAESARRIEQIRSSFGERKKRNLLEFGSRWLTAGARALTGSGAGGRSLLD